MTRHKPTARSARTIRAETVPIGQASTLHSESLAFALARDLPVIKPQTRKARKARAPHVASETPELDEQQSSATAPDSLLLS